MILQLLETGFRGPELTRALAHMTEIWGLGSAQGHWRQRIVHAYVEWMLSLRRLGGSYQVPAPLSFVCCA